MMIWLQQLGQERLWDVGVLFLAVVFIFKIAMVLPI